MSAGTLNPSIINSFDYEFEWQCISLLFDAYLFVKSNYRIDIDCEEEYISAVLFDYIDKSQQAIKWQIDITTEYRIYKNEVLKKKKTVKTAPRIDLRFCGWKNNTKLTCSVEAKNLIETDTVKKGRKSKISAGYLHKRYIDTGIDNYVSGRYPSNGCLVGYILQGEMKKIVDCINQHLQNCNREPEMLIRQSFELQNVDSFYLSKHNNDMTIKHLMLDFTVR